MQRFLTVALALTVQAGSAHAVVLPDDVQAALTQRYDAFVGAQGFKRIDTAQLRRDWYSHARFPHEDTTAFNAPDAGINAATRALMLLESREPALAHARYRITYRMDNAPDYGGYPNAYVEVTRFNLGPVIRADVADSIPAGVPVAPAEHFGLGPSVSWRFVMGWHQSRVADVVRASRRVLSPAQAKAMDCLGAPCLARENPHGPAGEWRPVTPPSTQPATYISQVNGIATAARVSERLYRQASGEQDRLIALPTHADKPQLIFVISMNIEGQDDSADGLLHQPLLRDDAVSDIWTRRRQAGHDAIAWHQRVEHYPGRQ